MTWLGYLNFLVLQWGFVRLARIVDSQTRRTIGWRWIGPVWPLTGWWNDYRFLGKARAA